MDFFAWGFAASAEARWGRESVVKLKMENGLAGRPHPTAVFTRRDNSAWVSEAGGDLCLIYAINNAWIS